MVIAYLKIISQHSPVATYENEGTISFMYLSNTKQERCPYTILFGFKVTCK